MKIALSPQRRDDNLTVVKAGETLTINGVAYDFSVVPEGGTLPKVATNCEWLADDLKRVDGTLHLTLILPNAVDASKAARFPDPLVDPADGTLPLPDQEVVQYNATSGEIDRVALVLPPTAAEALAQERSTMRCRAAAMRLVLHRQGLLAPVRAIADSDSEASIVFEYEPEFSRNDPFITSLGGPNGFTPEQIDDLFRAAMAL